MTLLVQIIVIFWVIFKLFYYNFKRAESIICKPPNDFIQVFAPPGTGKTTLAGKIVRNCIHNNQKVYSNVPLIGAEIFDLKSMGEYDFHDCTIIIDEAGSDLSNRNWQHNLNQDQIKFLKKHRHYNVDIWLFSQAYNDVDNKFRELTTKLIMLKKSRIPFFVRAMAIQKTMDLINGQIVEFFEWDRGSSFRFFTPNLWAYFNSYDVEKDLKEYVARKYVKIDTI